jgi:hypothetical protein
MERASSNKSTVGGKIGDVQFAARRRGKVDWRSRPAAALRTEQGAHGEAIAKRMQRGLLLDGIG